MKFEELVADHCPRWKIYEVVDFITFRCLDRVTSVEYQAQVLSKIESFQGTF